MPLKPHPYASASHSNSSFSSSDSSNPSPTLSSERQNNPSTTRTPRHQHRHAHSAPATFASHRTNARSADLASGPSFHTSSSSSSSSVSSDEETQVDKSTNPPLNDAMKSTTPTKKNRGNLKPNRSCAKGPDFDWSYRNVYTTGSKHGRMTMGGGIGAPGGCSVM